MKFSYEEIESYYGNGLLDEVIPSVASIGEVVEVLLEKLDYLGEEVNQFELQEESRDHLEEENKGLRAYIDTLEDNIYDLEEENFKLKMEVEGLPEFIGS